MESQFPRFCEVCKVSVLDESSWAVHIVSKKHTVLNNYSFTDTSSVNMKKIKAAPSLSTRAPQNKEQVCTRENIATKSQESSPSPSSHDCETQVQPVAAKKKFGLSANNSRRTKTEPKVVTQIECPHCNITILVTSINCGIFRCGVMKRTGRQIGPHLKEEKCRELVESSAIYGCGRPFRVSRAGDSQSEQNLNAAVTEGYRVEICDYIWCWTIGNLCNGINLLEKLVKCNINKLNKSSWHWSNRVNSCLTANLRTSCSWLASVLTGIGSIEFEMQ